MAWSVTRNIKQIRVQLERLNDTLSHQESATSPESRYGRGRTGPLGL